MADEEGTNNVTINITAVPDITARETVDSDGDGQIDQIKITTDAVLDDDFSGLTMTVAGYTVTGYSTDIANDNIFYVDLTESGSPDTDATPTVTVTANTTLSEDGGSNNIATDDTVAWWNTDWQNRTRRSLRSGLTGSAAPCPTCRFTSADPCSTFLSSMLTVP